jgi:hypothetical protein
LDMARSRGLPEADVLEVDRLVVDAARRRRDPRGEPAAVGAAEQLKPPP